MFLGAKRPLHINLSVFPFDLTVISLFFITPFPEFRIHIFFFADPDPGKIFMRIRILGVKGKNDFFFIVFFTFQMILNNGCLKSEQKK